MKLEKIVWEFSPQILPCAICGDQEKAEYIATVFVPGMKLNLVSKWHLCRKCANLHEDTVVRLLLERMGRNEKNKEDW